ncbi:uncharacterized protein LOC105195682 [Solenopsis invicta]|uniref:uncharacterized protein LOC105195682 n=1 Tax=Solenopsis invicta TaxID=13686 RepID=UPI00193CE4A0|nr:uncharacterized protein LOC105195682 [Solenopsis invicta]
MRVCEVFGCTSREGQGLRLFCFPKNQEQRLIWLSWIRVNRPEWTPKTNSRICELHFAANCYETREDGSKVLKRTATPSFQEKFVQNLENLERSKSIPKRFKIPRSRVVSLSGAKGSSKVKKSVVLWDHSYCSIFDSSQILLSPVSPITNSAVKEVTKGSAVWFADLDSQSRSINISSSHSNFFNVSMPTKAAQSLSSSPVKDPLSFDEVIDEEKVIIPSRVTENVSTQTTIDICNNASGRSDKYVAITAALKQEIAEQQRIIKTFEKKMIPRKLTKNISTQTTIDICNNVSVPTDKSATIIVALRKEVAEQQRINKKLEEDCNRIKKSSEKVYKMYFDTKRKYLAYKRKMERLKKKEK